MNKYYLPNFIHSVGLEVNLGEGLQVEAKQVEDPHVAIAPHAQAQLRRHVPLDHHPEKRSTDRRRP